MRVLGANSSVMATYNDLMIYRRCYMAVLYECEKALALRTVVDASLYRPLYALYSPPQILQLPNIYFQLRQYYFKIPFTFQPTRRLKIPWRIQN